MTSPKEEKTNAIIIDNQFYAYVPTCGHKDDCHGCHLRDKCRKMKEDFGCGYCAVFGAEIGYGFRLIKSVSITEQRIRGNIKRKTYGERI